MHAIQLNLPDTLDLEAKEIAWTLAGALYAQGKLSAGQAASLAGVSKRTFIEMIGSYGISVFSDDPDQLKRDLANA